MTPKNIVIEKVYKMGKHEDCGCKGHGKDHHKEMSREEKIFHFKECLDGTIERLDCLKEMFEEIITK